MEQTLWEKEDAKSVKIEKIMHLVDKLVDQEVFLAEMRGKGVKLMDSIESDKRNAITVTTRRIWDALEKL